MGEETLERIRTICQSSSHPGVGDAAENAWHTWPDKIPASFPAPPPAACVREKTRADYLLATKLFPSFFFVLFKTRDKTHVEFTLGKCATMRGFLRNPGNEVVFGWTRPDTSIVNLSLSLSFFVATRDRNICLKIRDFRGLISFSFSSCCPLDELLYAWRSYLIGVRSSLSSIRICRDALILTLAYRWKTAIKNSCLNIPGTCFFPRGKCGGYVKQFLCTFRDFFQLGYI